MKIEDLRQQSIEELKESLVKQSAELFNLRIQQTTGQLTQTHLIKNAKRSIARVKTVLEQKQAAGK
ncbi:MAG: 50S ribosomal protein L29 [Pseudomonadota bacterium]